MSFEYVESFPTITTDSVNSLIEPVSINRGGVYPGDIYIDSADSTIQYVIETGLNTSKSSIQVLASGSEQPIIKQTAGIEDMVASADLSHRCLSFTEYPSSNGDPLYFYIGYLEGGEYVAWWQSTTSNAKMIDIAGITESDQSIVTDSFAGLMEILDDYRNGQPPYSLRSQTNGEEAFDATFDEIISTTQHIYDQRKKRFHSSRRNTDSYSNIHKEVESVPTLANATGVSLDNGDTVYTSDCFIVGVEGDSIVGFPDADDPIDCLDDAELLIIQDDDKNSIIDFVSLRFFFSGRIEDFTPSDIRQILDVLERNGGRHLRCLARDAHVEVLHPESPATFSLHLYHAREFSSVDSREYFLLAYDSHATDQVKMEHPLALNSIELETVEDVIETLEVLATDVREFDESLDTTALSQDDIADVVDRAQKQLRSVGTERNIVESALLSE